MATRILVAIVLILTASAVGQNVQVTAKPLTEKDIQLLRQDVPSIKDEVIKEATEFTPAESEPFWPVYQEYAKAQRSIAEKRFTLTTEYVQKLETMDDGTAANLTTRLFQVEDDAQALRKNYYPRMEKALGAKRAAKFCQVDNRLYSAHQSPIGVGNSSDSMSYRGRRSRPTSIRADTSVPCRNFLDANDLALYFFALRTL